MATQSRVRTLCESQACPMHMTAASVGPYIFTTSELGAARCHASATLVSSGSPQKNVFLSNAKAFGLSSPIRLMNAAIEGTENQVVICCSVTNFDGTKV